VFDHRFLAQELSVRRHELDGLHLEVQLTNDEGSAIVAGRVEVRASVYFDATVSLTYRVVVSDALELCRASRALNTDDLAILAGLAQGIEHWHTQSADAQSEISLGAHTVTISDLWINEQGQPVDVPVRLSGSNEVLAEVLSRYACYFGALRKAELGERYVSSYTLVDVWEDIAHTGDAFSELTAPAIIEHIEQHHRPELMGLLTLYPYEWPYRDARSFDAVCGANIAIDTDDLVLVSDNMCLVVGTYGLRGDGSPTDWRAVFGSRRSRDHVCWPEYLCILDLLLAKQHTLAFALYSLMENGIVSSARLSNKKDIIRENAIFRLQLSNLMLSLDTAKFSRFASHKLMAKRTEARLDIHTDQRQLADSLREIDAALTSIDAHDQLRRSRTLRALLMFITVASVIQVVFQDLRLPIVERLLDSGWAVSIGTAILTSVLIGLLGLASWVLISLFSDWAANRRNRTLSPSKDS
jgi:hypothetical protein